MKDQEILKKELAELLEEQERRARYCKFNTIFPDEGPYRRELYPKHMQFMAAGLDHPQRAIVAANRTGKTLMGAFETTAHLTGLYPKWWTGRKFDFPISAWAASIRNSDTKGIIQYELFGDPVDYGSGMIPKDCIGRMTKKTAIQDAIDVAYIKHHTDGVFDGWSQIQLLSYEQGRDGFQGREKQLIWLDEEPKDYSIFTECLTRTMETKGRGGGGLIFCTFTPLFGLSEVVLSFLPDGKFPENNEVPGAEHMFISNVDWDEVPHLTEDDKKRLLAAYKPHERLARSKGIPSLGSGAIYPYIEDDITIEPFEIPFWWPRSYGLDVGWNRKAAVWGARDPDTGVYYLYSEAYSGETHPAVFASGIKARGDWINGVVDPASRQTRDDGLRILDLYTMEGLNLDIADHSIEAGIYKTGQMLESGQLKIFSTLKNWLSEYRIYRRDEKGKIVKSDDHLMDCTRYWAMSGLDVMTTKPDPDAEAKDYYSFDSDRSSITGY